MFTQDHTLPSQDSARTDVDFTVALNTALTLTIDPRILATHCEFHLCVNKFWLVEPVREESVLPPTLQQGRVTTVSSSCHTLPSSHSYSLHTKLSLF